MTAREALALADRVDNRPFAVSVSPPVAGSPMFRHLRHGLIRVGARVFECPEMVGRRERVVLVCPCGEVRTRGGWKQLGWLRELHAVPVGRTSS